MKQHEIVALAARAAIDALRSTVRLDDELTLPEWEGMYLAQCTATDEWAKRARIAEEAKAPATLEKRVKELEGQLAAVNRRLTEANGSEAHAVYGAAKAAKEALDDCTHPDCLVDRERNGYSSCAGGHLARRVVKAIIGSERLVEPERA